MSLNRSTISVSELTSKLKELIESNFSNIWIQGEISNFKHHSSGHMYFTLKDQGAELRCIMFRGFNQGIHFKPEDGMDVILKGKITVYEPRGQYQVMVQNMEPAGVGTLFLAFEALKKQLQSEGLFDTSLKNKLPQFPKKIGIVTSQTGAAFKDMVQVLNRRAPYVDILLRPTLVQGDNAANDIVKAIKEISLINNIDVLIIGRGGGSLEDLWAFNEEVVARAIVACKIPIISAVGHETDITISDMVSDLRAPTPSAAAEIVALSVRDLKQKINEHKNILFKQFQFKLNKIWQTFDHLTDRLTLQKPQNIIQRQKEKINILSDRLLLSMNHLFTIIKTKSISMNKELNILNPSDILKRGYSIIYNTNGAIVRKGQDLKENDLFEAQIGQDRIEAVKKRDIFKDN
ncbi:MAG: exodeoxyribonuclease VII large subunit [Fidelibacterota bacterium]|jgi:exodeoxyribonuclease VII large subunit|tara:strand:+ start:306 stop:1517 length:1212 start_codon:yes stop_codon:yes gene_type:complete